MVPGDPDPLDVPILIARAVKRQTANGLYMFISDRLKLDPSEDVSVLTFNDGYEEWSIKNGLQIKQVDKEMNTLAEFGLKVRTVCPELFALNYCLP